MLFAQQSLYRAFEERYCETDYTVNIDIILTPCHPDLHNIPTIQPWKYDAQSDVCMLQYDTV